MKKGLNIATQTFDNNASGYTTANLREQMDVFRIQDITFLVVGSFIL